MSLGPKQHINYILFLDYPLFFKAVQNILELNAAQNNTESVSIPQRNLSQVSLPSHRMDNSTR